ncbi:hypothetical protein BGZ47_002922 [Haplosporangium gracile]|nr:hypothetical protein BGZ47_002922 [Haplosporangium gracile]
MLTQLIFLRRFDDKDLLSTTTTTESSTPLDQAVAPRSSELTMTACDPAAATGAGHRTKVKMIPEEAFLKISQDLMLNVAKGPF